MRVFSLLEFDEMVKFKRRIVLIVALCNEQFSRIHPKKICCNVRIRLTWDKPFHSLNILLSTAMSLWQCFSSEYFLLLILGYELNLVESVALRALLFHHIILNESSMEGGRIIEKGCDREHRHLIRDTFNFCWCRSNSK